MRALKPGSSWRFLPIFGEENENDTASDSLSDSQAVAERYLPLVQVHTYSLSHAAEISLSLSVSLSVSLAHWYS